jgi:hypothetical protein
MTNKSAKKASEGTHGREAMGGPCGPGEPSGAFLWNVVAKDEAWIYSADMDESKRKPLSLEIQLDNLGTRYPGP